MYFKSFQINGFGKMEGKQISLEPGLNLILGKNESGKSTIADFIKGIFYGINRNKNGKMYSDYERWKPWNDGMFSGSLVYAKDDKEYRVYRDFHRNQAQIYEENHEITSQFDKDKSRGAEIGLQHFGMDEETFENSMFVRQKEIQIDELSQHRMIEKLTNLIQTGEETVSYEAMVKKLEKALVEEIGTERTQNRPKNQIKREIASLEIQQSQQLKHRMKQEELEQRRKELQAQQEQNEKQWQDTVHIFDIRNKYEKTIQEAKAKFDLEKKMREEEKETWKKKNQRKRTWDTVLIAVGIILLASMFCFRQEFWYAFLTVGIGLLGMIINLMVSYQEVLSVNPDNFDLISEESRKKEQKELEALQQTGVKKALLDKKVYELKTLLEEEEREKNRLTVEDHKLRVEEESLEEGLATLTEIEEELAVWKEKLVEINQKEEGLRLALAVWQEAYQELKQETIPNVEKQVKEAIQQTTNGEYCDVLYQEEEGLLTENRYGQMVSVEKLSMGTIDQMYLGFRFAVAQQFEAVPFILDETFAFFDEERLAHVLRVLAKMAETRQIIVLSCSKREEEFLQRENIPYHRVDLEEQNA